MVVAALIGLGLVATTAIAGAYGVGRYADMQQSALATTGQPLGVMENVGFSASGLTMMLPLLLAMFMNRRNTNSSAPSIVVIDDD
jgi:glucan phosphoethanolaminetransferase (alkaline phosphatase superfamily)